EQAHPDQAANETDMLQVKQSVKKIDPCRITEFAPFEDRIIRPERNPIGEILDQSDVEREITEIVWGLDAELVAIDVKEPAEGTDCKNCKANHNQPFPDVSIPKLS